MSSTCLLREEQTAAFSCEKFEGGSLENSDFICLLNQASGDRKILAERLNISPQQLRYVDNPNPARDFSFTKM